jgi:hypothetical protein
MSNVNLLVRRAALSVVRVQVLCVGCDTMSQDKWFQISKALQSHEMSGNMHPLTHHHIPADLNHQRHCC